MYSSYLANAIAERVHADARRAAHVADAVIPELGKNEPRENDVMGMFAHDAHRVRHEVGALAAQLDRIASTAAALATGLRERHQLPTGEWG